MRVHLFVPCYVDQFYPQVGVATLRLLEKLGCEVVYAPGQTCCGQPMANSGAEAFAKTTYENYVTIFADAEYVVTPSGSCAAHVRHHYDVLEQTPAVERVRERTYELCEFIVDVLGTPRIEGAAFPHRVGLHQSCHGLRHLRLASDSERVTEPFSKIMPLLEQVAGLELVELDRVDECCGFGGTFAVAQEALSVRMGRDRLSDHVRHGAEYIVSADMSCMMHLEGLARRQGVNVQVKHVAELLVSRIEPPRPYL